MDLEEELETGIAFSLPSPEGYSTLLLGLEAHAAASSTRGESTVLQLYSSEEVDVLCIEAWDIEDSSHLTPAYEELVEVITCAMSKLNIDCPAEIFYPQNNYLHPGAFHFFPTSTKKF